VGKGQLRPARQACAATSRKEAASQEKQSLIRNGVPQNDDDEINDDLEWHPLMEAVCSAAERYQVEHPSEKVMIQHIAQTEGEPAFIIHIAFGDYRPLIDGANQMLTAARDTYHWGFDNDEV
jgi:hypothetical protein